MSCFKCGQQGHFAADCIADVPAPLVHVCPVCGAGPGQPCVNLVSGLGMFRAGGEPATHPARADARYRRLAQVSRETRAEEDIPEPPF